MQEQLLIRVWIWCNYKCIFCNVTEYNEKSILHRESYLWLINQFNKKIKQSNLSKLWVTLSWWEPSLFKKEIYFIVKYISNYCKKEWIEVWFDMQTNWTEFDNKFTLWLIKNDIFDFLISFHTIEKNIFESLLGISYDKYFFKVVDNIKFLESKGAAIQLNTIVSKLNYGNFLDTIKFILSNFNNVDLTIWIFQPHWYWDKNFDKLFISYEEIYKKYNYILYFVERKWRNINSHYCWLPLCYLYNKKYSLEYERNLWLRKEMMFDDKFLINKINDDNKVHTKDCDSCMYNNLCSWIWKEYEWKQKLRPVIYKRYFWNVNSKSNYYYLNSLNDNLKKIYSKNIKHIVLPSSILYKNKKKDLIKELVKIWFYKITLLVDSDIDYLNDLFFSGITNISVSIENITMDAIYDLVSFSEKYSPQFRIDLDIYIDKYNLDIVKKIRWLTKILTNKYVNIFILDNDKWLIKLYKILILKSKWNIYLVNKNWKIKRQDKM